MWNLTIFQRIYITKQLDKEIVDHFKFEFAPYPMSLFSDGVMRKGAKIYIIPRFHPTPRKHFC